MKALDNLSKSLQTLNKKIFERYLGLFLIIVALFSSLTSYYIYSKSKNLVAEIKKLEELVNKTTKLIKQNELLEQKEQELQQLLGQNKEFNMKTFFEQFTAQQGMLPDPGWETVTQPVEGSEKFDEVILPAIFKNQTTQNLVKFLDALDKNPTIFIKELFIRNAGNKQINFDITIATKKYIG